MVSGDFTAAASVITRVKDSIIDLGLDFDLRQPFKISASLPQVYVITLSALTVIIKSSVAVSRTQVVDVLVH